MALLMTMLRGGRAILLNRATAANPSRELGAALAATGRDTIEPLIVDLNLAVRAGQREDMSEHADRFLRLFISDLQIRCVIGVLCAPADVEIERRSENALDAFFTLIGER